VIMLIARIRPTNERDPGPRGRHRMRRPSTTETHRSKNGRERCFLWMGLSDGKVVKGSGQCSEEEGLKIGLSA
jgi:hypothetical protein